ncbi:CHAT domain-containing protein [Nostoc sp. UHCC 0702]|nr:CHAT domain-containing protein [Nostoc sp. UHCC 0702]
MHKKQHRWRSRKARFFYGSQVRSLILAVVLFLSSVGGVLVTSDVWASTAIVQTQKEPLQLVEQGKLLYQNREFESALGVWLQVAAAFAARGDKLNQAMALSNLSLTAQQLGKWEQAKQAIATSLNILQTQPKSPAQQQILGSTLDIQGKLQLAVGESGAALTTWQQAAKIYQNLGNQNGAIKSQINQAQAMQDLGLYPRACKTLLKTLELENQNCEITKEQLQTLQQRNSSSLQILALRSLGNVLRVVNQLEQSQMALLTAEQLAQQSGDSENLAATYLSLGNTSLAFANRSLLRDTTEEENILPLSCGHKRITEQAKTYYNNAFDFYQKTVDISTLPIATLQAQLNRLRGLLYLHQQPTSQDLTSIKSTLETLTPSRVSIYARVNFAESLHCVNQGIKAQAKSVSSPDETVQLLNTAIQQAKAIKDQRAESYALGHLGQLYEQAQQWEIAKKYTESALKLTQIINTRDITYQWYWQLGRILLAQKNFPEAVAAYTDAVTILKSLRSDLVALNPDIQFDFRDQVEPVYRQLVTLLLQPERPSAENLKQARNVIEALQLAELDNFFRDACIIAQPTEIDEIVDNANSPTAVIYPIILADRLEVIVKLPRQKQLTHYRTYIAKTEVESTLEKLRQNLEQRYTFREREILSQEVYNWLIKPAEKELAQNKIKTLVFVLDGSLRNIPIAALYDGKQYLVEKYSVALSPGLQLIEPKQQKQKFEAFTGGLTEPRFGFSPLPNVANELQEIKSVIPTRQLLNQTFTSTTIEKQISSDSFAIVHLATHGKFSSQLEDTFILAWNGKINAKQLREVLQFREDTRGSRVGALKPIELLVLSACETATGDKRAALGLAGMAVRSGARSTLASLWQVDDQSTSILMAEFYRQLKNNPIITKAEALRRAQESILKQYKEHPFYWAPYVLVGNWL